jgi:cytochrome P450
MAAIPLVHRRAELYEEPKSFCPDRFLRRPPPGPPSWLPFGTGPRRCLGYHLAPSVMAKMLERLVSVVRLAPSRPGDERQRLLATIAVPDAGCLVRVTERRTR